MTTTGLLNTDTSALGHEEALALWLALGERLGAPEPPPVHLRCANDDSTWSVCGHGGGETRALLSGDPAKVTCAGCLRSTDYRAVNERAQRKAAVQVPPEIGEADGNAELHFQCATGEIYDVD